MGGEDLEGGHPGGLGQGMGVRAEEQGAVDALLGPVLADRLAGRGDVVLVEGRGEGGAAVSRGAEGDALAGIRRIGVQGVVRGHQPGHVDQVLRARLLPRSFVEHPPIPP